MRLAIIGAGVAGLAAAQTLRHRRRDVNLVVFEKNRDVGGRVATRWAHQAIFDYGAQYIKTPTSSLERLLCRTLPHATLVDIARPVWVFDAAGTISEGDLAQNAEPKWTYRDGLTRLAKELARDLPIRLQTPIGRIAHANGSYVLFDEQDHIVGAADAVLFTPPAPQTYAMIEASALPTAAQTALLDQLKHAPYRPCLTLTLGYPPLLKERPWYALVNTDKQHPISWLAYEHYKPGRAKNQHVVIAQMAPAWSEQHWDDPLPVTAANVVELVNALLGEDVSHPRWADRRSWRYALPDGNADFDALNTALAGLFFAGDYTAGQGRVHLAIEQGWQVAERLAAFADERVVDARST